MVIASRPPCRASYARLEAILLLLPPGDSDAFLQQLGDADLLELECTSRTVHAVLRRSDQYWRGCYGRRFHWRHVAHEQDFLLWYRNKVWRESRRPGMSSVDLLDGAAEHAAFAGVSWKAACQYRLLVQHNWLGKQHRHWRCDEHAADAVSGIHIMPTSASSIPLKVVSEERVRLTYLRPAEIPHSIDSVLADTPPPLLPASDPVASSEARHIKPIISNGCYTVVESRGTFFVRPTYSDHTWVPFALPGFPNRSGDFKRTLTFGRWVVFRGYGEEDAAWLVNLATRQYAQLPPTIRYVHAILSADPEGVVLLTAPTASTRYRVDWCRYRCRLASCGRPAIELLSAGFFCITAVSDRIAISSLGPDYAYIEYQTAGIYPTLAIYDITEDGGPEPLCHLDEAWPAYRLDRRRAMVETQYFCNIIDLPTGDILHAYNYGALLNLKPILGGLFLSTGMKSTQIVDVYSGIPQATIVAAKQVNWPLIQVYSTFLFFKPVSGAVSIFDFTVA
ncbi:hypothetical protein SYNPS1DRAFT_22702 [Syncephalis pseudoplumigaleata]|uniref:Uncharacterized protein n=1 Tax=Syncephalis pseudoplumigaleata TaxID=1712513 RepID=A0A4P9Z1M0_9FUNG|nr:hypothetical protein SYNPS1DRAFT_22702 [Syncephalis pseudoplumigaleata]|eukprot:RKP25320.1 hypothetical protein SYNPS1DRAFT_22702 [Syncephalis pseudoplumigaleata]